MQINKPITIRLAPEEMRFIEEQAELAGIGIGQAARKIIQTALLDGRDAQRLAVLENRLKAMIDAVPERTARLLVSENE